MKQEPLENRISGRTWLEIHRVFKSREKASKVLGISTATISNYKFSKSEPRTAILAEMSKHGCDIMWIITGEKTA